MTLEDSSDDGASYYDFNEDIFSNTTVADETDDQTSTYELIKPSIEDISQIGTFRFRYKIHFLQRPNLITDISDSPTFDIQIVECTAQANSDYCNDGSVTHYYGQTQTLTPQFTISDPRCTIIYRFEAYDAAGETTGDGTAVELNTATGQTLIPSFSGPDSIPYNP